MPFDGVVTKSIVDEFNNKLKDGRIDRAFQTEKDEITLLVRARGENQRLLVSASPTYARIHLTENVKDNPQTPPVFCMLLRKHIVGGRIAEFKHYDYDRIIEMTVNTTNDFNEPVTKYLIVEIMGKYSNIILLNENRFILDSIKHVSNDISSVREVMPGRKYELPPSQNKKSPEEIHQSPELLNNAFTNPEFAELRVDKAILSTIRGFSPMLSREVFYRCDFPEGLKVKNMTEHDVSKTISTTSNLLSDIIEGSYHPCVYFKDSKLTEVFDYHTIRIEQYPYKKDFDDISLALDFYYASKDNTERLHQKKSALLKVLSNNIERCKRKISIQEDSKREAAKMDTYKLYGDLLTANIYRIESNTDKAVVENFYNENMEQIEIPIEPTLSPSENAQRYYKKYTKARNTKTNAEEQLVESRNELAYLEAVDQMLEMAQSADEITEIRQELVEGGYVKERKKKGKAQNKKLTYRVHQSDDGFEILVGKNNKQNDELTLKVANKNDLWLHTKDIPGSHVIIRAQRQEVPESTIIQAAKLAALYSKAANSQNVPVDYTLVKNVRKPQGAKPGMVIYDSQHTVYVTPDSDQSPFQAE